MTASTITIVTKNTPQSYTGGTTSAAKGTALSVLEVDSNFINLKEGLINLETSLATTDASIRSYVNTNFVQSFSPVFTGTPTAPNPGGTGASQLQTVTAVNDLLTPISTTINSPTIGNQALAGAINLKADLNSPQFIGFPRLTGTSYVFSTWDAVDEYLATVEYIQDKLTNLSSAIKPATAGGAALGTSTEHFNELHVNTILPAGSSSSLGTNTNRFEFAYIEELHVGENTIFVGQAQISADGSTLVVPVNTAIGDQENVIPPNIASTKVDKRFSGLGLSDNLDQSFTASGSITARDPVAINSNGTVSTISGSVSNLEFIGIALASAADTAAVTVRVHGTVSGFTGLTAGTIIFAENNGTLVQTKTTTALKVGVATSTTEAFFFTTSNLDTYLLNIKKTELTDFSVTTNATASGAGGLSYNSSTGAFTLTPADTSTFATTAYVDTEVANLVDSAPTSLDTLNELAAALNDDANFATTVTNSIATKAPLASPALTGTPTAPTASTSTNTTQIATTAYVQSEIASLGNASLTSFSITSNSASGGGSLAYNNTNGVFTYTPPDLSSVLSTETDPVVGAITGIVKADGSGNISAAVAGTDYSTFDGAFSSLTGKPTTISGYGITDAAPLASPNFTGAPTAPTASSGVNSTQLATTAFVQAAVTSGSGISLTDLSTTTGAASGGGSLSYNNSTGVFTFIPANVSSFGNASLNSFSISTTSASGAGSLSYNNSNGVFSFTPADLSTFSTFDGAFSSLTGKPTTISGYGITDAFNGVYGSLTGKPTTISGYGITDAFNGVYGSLSGIPSTLAHTNADIDIGSNDFITTGKVLFANMYSALSDLPSASTYHGMFAHVHATGGAYFAHAGNWVELANKSYVDTQVSTLIDSAPGALDTLNELAAALGDDANFSTTVTNSIATKAPLASPALTGVPTSPTAPSGTNTTQLATTAFVTAAVAAGGGGGGGASVTTSDAAPSSPSAGDLWYNTSAGGLFVYYTDANSSQWVEVVGKTGATGASGVNVNISDAAPTSPSTGQFWWNSSTNKLYIYYTDANSSQWVQATTPGADGADGSNAAITRYVNLAAFPSSPTAADLAYANDTNTLYLYNGTAWEVVASGNDESPVITTEPPTVEQALNSDGTTSTVTMVAQDPEGFDIVYGIAYKTANNARPTQLSSDTTINQSTGVYTFTPTTTVANAGTFRARLSASDGARITTRFVDFNLSFYPVEDSAILGRYEFTNTTSYNPSVSTTALNDLSGNGNNQTIVNPGTHTGSSNMTFNTNTTIAFSGLNATKAWFVLYYPTAGWDQAILFGAVGSTHYATFQNGNTSTYYGTNYSAHSGETIVDRVNGTNPGNNRGTGYSAMNISQMNSVINSGTDMTPSTGLQYNSYANWQKQHYVRAMVFFNRVLTLTEMEDLHNHYRTEWVAAGGTMTTWGN